MRQLGIVLFLPIFLTSHAGMASQAVVPIVESVNQSAISIEVKAVEGSLSAVATLRNLTSSAVTVSIQPGVLLPRAGMMVAKKVIVSVLGHQTATKVLVAVRLSRIRQTDATGEPEIAPIPETGQLRQLIDAIVRAPDSLTTSIQVAVWILRDNISMGDLSGYIWAGGGRVYNDKSITAALTLLESAGIDARSKAIFEPAVLQSLEADDPALRAEAIHLAGPMPDGLVPYLAVHLESRDWMERTAAVRTLGKSKDPRVLDILLTQLTKEMQTAENYRHFYFGGLNDGEQVEVEIARTLRSIGDPRAIPALKAAEESISSGYRFYFTDAILALEMANQEKRDH